MYLDFLCVQGFSLFLLMYIWCWGDISPMSMAYSYSWVVDYIWLICHDNWIMNHDIQFISNWSWFSEASHEFGAHESSAESEEKALKTILCPIEAPRAAIQPVPKLQLTGFPVDFLQHVPRVNHWTAARPSRAVKTFWKRVLFVPVSPKFPQLLYFVNQNGPSLQWKSKDHLDGPINHPYKLSSYAHGWIRDAEI